MSKTLRQWIYDYREHCCSSLEEEIITKGFKKVISNIIEYNNNFYLGNENLINCEKISLSLKQYFSKLYSSVPMSIPRNKIEHFLLLVNRKICNAKIEKIFSEIQLLLSANAQNTDNRIIHADLHLNNILVTNTDFEVKIIDWENISTGSILLDLNYMYCFIRFLLEGLPHHQQYVKEEFSKFFTFHLPHLKEAFFNVSDLFDIGISTNRSFGYNVPFMSFLKNLFSFHSKLNKI